MWLSENTVQLPSTMLCDTWKLFLERDQGDEDWIKQSSSPCLLYAHTEVHKHQVPSKPTGHFNGCNSSQLLFQSLLLYLHLSHLFPELAIFVCTPV